MPIASRMICPATTATTRMIVAYTVARSAVRRRSARVRDAVNPAKIATLPIGSIVVQIVAKSLLILMSKGDMVNAERLTPEVERERGKVTTLGQFGISANFLHFPGSQEKGCRVRCPQRSKSKIHLFCAETAHATARRVSSLLSASTHLKLSRCPH